MTQAEALIEDPVAEDHLPVETFRFLTEDDIAGLVDLGCEFFLESEFPGFSTFAPGRFEGVLRRSLDNPYFPTFVFVPEGRPEGFLTVQLDNPYTVELLALGFLFYVTPPYRKSPAGRILQSLALAYAKDCGAVAYYGGVMSGVETVQKTMPNLYRKLGFEDLWWGRLILKDGA
jgi:GNAT superfamily N-acetyltransferase